MVSIVISICAARCEEPCGVVRSVANRVAGRRIALFSTAVKQ